MDFTLQASNKVSHWVTLKALLEVLLWRYWSLALLWGLLGDHNLLGAHFKNWLGHLAKLLHWVSVLQLFSQKTIWLLRCRLIANFLRRIFNHNLPRTYPGYCLFQTLCLHNCWRIWLSLLLTLIQIQLTLVALIGRLQRLHLFIFIWPQDTYWFLILF